MEISPSWEAANCAATQEFFELVGSLLCLQDPSTGLFIMPDQSSPYHWARLIQFVLPYLICIRSILILCVHLRLVVPFLMAFLPISSMLPLLPFSSYIPCPSHTPWHHHPNYTWRRVQVMKLIMLQLSPTSCHFIPLRSKYSLQHCVPPSMSESKFHTHTEPQAKHTRHTNRQRFHHRRHNHRTADWIGSPHFTKYITEERKT
jgi:hypothetical protein